MATERRIKEVSSDDDSHLMDSCNDTYDTSKRKRKHTSISCLLLCASAMMPGMRANLLSLASSFKQNPAATTKRVCFKLVFWLWCVIVLLSILSLLGFPVNPFKQQRSKRMLMQAEADGETFSSWHDFIPEAFAGLLDDAEEEQTQKPEDASEEEDIPVQILPVTPKVGNRLNKKLERELACTELSCIDSCNKKIKPKCAKSLSCRKERDKLCHRRCRKQRCEDRCKDEPKFGYVEREQRMEKCKDECTGPTAVHNKCIKKCHSQFKPCKSRCHEIAGKYTCDKPQFMDVVKDEEEEEVEESEDDGEGGEEIESESPKSKPSLRISGALDLIEDPEVI